MCVVGSVSVVGLVSCGIVTCVALRALVDLFVPLLKQQSLKNTDDF